MLKRSQFGVMLISMLIFGALFAGTAGNISPTRVYKPASFTGVEIQGNVDVRLHTGYKEQKVALYGRPDDLKHVVFKVKNGTLYIRSKHTYFRKQQRIKVVIHSSELRAFKYVGCGTIVAPKMNTNAARIYIDNDGNTTLHGEVGLSQLTLLGKGTSNVKTLKSHRLCLTVGGQQRVKLDGTVNLAQLKTMDQAWLSLNWVNSPALIIEGYGQSFIQLAGVVNKMDVTLWNNARFRGRYLRAERAFVRTFGQSVASITALKRQHALASDASNIYFYNLADMRTDFMAFNGAVLDMRDWNNPTIRPYDRYNKML